MRLTSHQGGVLARPTHRSQRFSLSCRSISHRLRVLGVGWGRSGSAQAEQCRVEGGLERQGGSRGLRVLLGVGGPGGGRRGEETVEMKTRLEEQSQLRPWSQAA